jgi:hypothetical protein
MSENNNINEMLARKARALLHGNKGREVKRVCVGCKKEIPEGEEDFRIISGTKKYFHKSCAQKYRRRLIDIPQGGEGR